MHTEIPNGSKEVLPGIWRDPNKAQRMFIVDSAKAIPIYLDLAGQDPSIPAIVAAKIILQRDVVDAMKAAGESVEGIVGFRYPKTPGWEQYCYANMEPDEKKREELITQGQRNVGVIQANVTKAIAAKARAEMMR